jgi:thiol-disulfide isomerase/thioredoxin
MRRVSAPRSLAAPAGKPITTGNGRATPAAPGPDSGTAGSDVPPEAGLALSSDQLGSELGSRATLVQFSSAFCAPCRATRRILADVAGTVDGVRHVEIDAESRLDLVRELNVLRTPTVLVLAADGRVVRRASGQPRKPDVVAALGEAIAVGGAAEQPLPGFSGVQSSLPGASAAPATPLLTGKDNSYI